MGTRLQKIVFSSLALVISFIFKIEIIRDILQILSCLVLLEEVGKQVIIKIKQKNILNPSFLLCLISICFIVQGHFLILLEFLIFYHLEEYLLETFLKKNEKRIITSLKKENEETNLKTVAGYVKVKWGNVKIGDILYIKKQEPCYVEGTLLAEKTTYQSFFEEKINKIRAGETLPSGCLVLEDTLIKASKNYESSSYKQMISRLENIDENENMNLSIAIEKKYNQVLIVFALFICFASILYLRANITGLILILAGVLTLFTETNLKTILYYTYFNSLIKTFKQGIYFMKKDIFEEISKIKIVIFSKFGVLTKGRLSLSKIIPVYQTKEEVLKLAALTEYGSTHPMAIAILNYYDKPIEQEKIYLTEEIKGMGKKAIIEGKTIYIGNKLLFDKLKITYPKVEFSQANCMLAIDNTYVATFVFNDEMKEDSYLVSSLLREEGVEKVVLFSSATTEQVKKLGSSLSMNESYADLTLEDKVEVLKMYQKEAKTMYVDAFVMDEQLKNNTDLSVLCGASSNADIVLPDFDINNLVFLKHQASSLEKKFKILLVSYLILKFILFILLITQVLTIEYTMFILLLYYFIVIMLSLKDLRR